MLTHEPTQIIILGGAGDLSQRKLLPALFNLFAQGLLPSEINILGFARTVRTDDEYRQLVSAAIERSAEFVDQNVLKQFCTHISYVTGSIDDESGFEALATAIGAFEAHTQQPSNRLFYLAVPPHTYSAIFKYLYRKELAKPGAATRWARILIEKPFGHDYASALELDTELSSLFAEEQIYRIDHYLAKEAVQNILSFRFANTLLRSSWNKNHIKEVRITMHESIDAASRGAFYDTVGALRDVGQNHLLQILALIAMDEPEEFTAEHIRERRAAILQKLVPFTSASASEVVRGQYAGYTDIAGVALDSVTETYFEFKTTIDTDTWSGVPFYISGGKALRHEEVTVEIMFKEVATGPFVTKGNTIILTVSPVQSMNITLNVKKPGHGYTLEPNTLSFAWDEENRGVVNAYEKVLLDCIGGDRTIFTKTEEVLASWKFISSITDIWNDVPLQIYQQGSDGPEHSLFRTYKS